MTFGPRALVAFAASVAIVLGQVPLVVAAPTSLSKVTGRVFATDLVTPAASLTVQAIPDGAKEPAGTTQTDAKGRFRLSDLPAGRYLLLLSDASGSPVAATPVVTRAGERQDLTLALPDRKPGETATAPGAALKGGLWAWLSSPVGATVALVGGAVVLAAGAKSATDSDDEPPVSQR